jgi:tetratricopeptide (TPR) repeat protein
MKIWYDYAVLQLSFGDYYGAESSLKNSVIVNPYFADSYYQLAKIYDKQGRLLNAFAASLKYLAIDPKGQYAKQELDLYLSLITDRLVRDSEESFVITDKQDLVQELRENNIKYIYTNTEEDMSITVAMLQHLMEITKGKYDSVYSKKDDLLITKTMLEVMFSTYISKEENFVNKYFLAYFKKLFDRKLTEVFSYYIFQVNETDEVKLWLNQNQEKVDILNLFVKNYNYN